MRPGLFKDPRSYTASTPHLFPRPIQPCEQPDYIWSATPRRREPNTPTYTMTEPRQSDEIPLLTRPSTAHTASTRAGDVTDPDFYTLGPANAADFMRELASRSPKRKLLSVDTSKLSDSARKAVRKVMLATRSCGSAISQGVSDSCNSCGSAVSSCAKDTCHCCGSTA